MTVNYRRVALATAALRSGEYPQTTGSLRNADGYCCLGVFTEVAIANGLQLEAGEGRGGIWEYGASRESSLLPVAVARWYGFTGTNPELTSAGGVTAITANDSARRDFNWIADAFDATYGPKEDDSDA